MTEINYEENARIVAEERDFIEKIEIEKVKEAAKITRTRERSGGPEARHAWNQAMRRAVTKGEGLLIPQRPESTIEIEEITRVVYSPGAYIGYIVYPENGKYSSGASYRVSSAARRVIEDNKEEFVNVRLGSGEEVVVTVLEAFELGLREVEFECNPPR